MSTIYDWSITAEDNATSDDTIDWAEGMPPSAVNNSARSMMTRVRQLIYDVGGILIATDTSTDNSIVVNPSSPISGSYPDGFMISFRTNRATTGPFTLNVRGIGDVAVYKNSSTGIVRAGAADIYAGGIYTCVYAEDLISGEAGWILTNPSQIPLGISGQIGTFLTRTAPVGWLRCDGGSYLRADYPALFNVIGKDWSPVNVPEDQFNVPNFKGLFLRGWNDGEGFDPNRQWASFQQDEFKQHNHPNSIANEAGAHIHDFGIPWGTDGSGGYRAANRRSLTMYQTEPAGSHTHTLSISQEGANETRPSNYPVLYCIKT